MVQKDLRDFNVSKDCDVNQRSIAELILNVGVGSPLGQEPYTIDVAFDGKKMPSGSSRPPVSEAWPNHPNTAVDRIAFV